MSQEMPLMPAFTAGFTVFALLTMFHYVTVAHISPTVTFGFALRIVFQIDNDRSIKCRLESVLLENLVKRKFRFQASRSIYSCSNSRRYYWCSPCYGKNFP